MKKKENSNHFFYMYKRLFLCIFTHKIFIIIFCFGEFLDIFSCSLSIIPDFFNYNEIYSEKDVKIVKILYKISPYHYFLEQIFDYNKYSIKKIPAYITIFIFIIFWVIFYITLYSFGDFNYEHESLFNQIKSIFLINFYSYFFLRIIAIFGVNSLISLIFSIIFQKTYSFVDILILFLLIMLLIGDTLSKYSFFTEFSVLLKFKFQKSLINKYPFDTFFGEQYDKIFIFIKILICIQNNYYFQNKHQVNVLLLFIDFLILMGILSLGLYLLKMFFLNKDSLIYISLNDITLYRIIFINQSCVSIIFFFLFYDKDDYILFTCFSIIYFIIQVIISVTNFENYITSQAILSKNILGVCWFFQTNNIDHGTFITSWVVNHKINCEKFNCEICQELNEKEKEENFDGLDFSPKKKQKAKITKFHTTILKENNISEEKSTFVESYNINSIMKAFPPFNFISKLLFIAHKQRHLFDNNDILRLDFLYLTVLFLSQSNQHFRFFRNIFILTKKYRNQERIVSMLRTITELVKNSNKDLIDRYFIIKKNEDLKNDMLKYIKDFQKFLNFEIKTPENYLKIANKFVSIKQHPNISSIIRKNNDYDYKMLVLRFIYESLINPKPKNSNEFDIGFYIDFLNFHYRKDKIILLSFSIERRAFTIIRGSKQILKYNGKNFDSLFPEFFKTYGINICIDKLKNADIKDKKNYIELLCKDLSSSEDYGFVNSLKIEYAVYPTIKIDELLIDMSYYNDYINVIIFKIENNIELLFSFSPLLFKYFGLTPEILDVLNKAGKNITFQEIFNVINSTQNGRYLCLFKNYSYFQLYKELMKVEGINECTNYIGFNKSNILSFEEGNNEIYFSLSKKLSLDDQKRKLNIYFIKEQRRKNTGTLVDSKPQLKTTIMFSETLNLSKTNYKTNESNDKSTSNENNKDAIKKYNPKDNNLGGAPLSLFSQASMSALSFNKNNISGIKNVLNNKTEEKHKRYKQVTYFTLSIFIYGLCLMILAFTCLIFVLREKNVFKRLFDLFQYFKKFQRSIEITPLSLFANFCYFSKGNKECVNYYENYSKDIQNKKDSFKKIPLINIALQLDLPGRFEISLTSFKTFENEIYVLNLNDIKNQEISKFKILINNSSIIIQREVLLFLDLIREYMNWLTYILQNNYLEEKFALLNFTYNDNNQQIIITADNSTQLSQIKKNMYLVLLNNPMVNVGLEKICDTIQKKFQNSFNILKGYLFGFFIALLILHIILYFICYSFLFVLIKMLKLNIFPMNSQFENLKYITFIQDRFSNLKVLCELYSENPNQIINTITSDEEAFKKEIKDRIQNKNSNNNDSNNDSKENVIHKTKLPEINDKHFIIIVQIYKIVITITFLLYFIYTIVFFICVDMSKRKLLWLVDYSNINQKLDSYTYDTFNSLIYLMLTNSSRYDIGKRTLNLENYDYLFEKMVELHQVIREKETMEVIHKNIFPPLNTQVDLNCLNAKIDDQVMRNALNQINIDLKDFLYIICENFPISTIGDDTMFIKNILYLLNQLYNKYYQGNFEDIQNLIQQPDLFNLYTFVLIINRIIRFYFNESIFKQEIDNIFHHFSNLIIPYLIFNMIWEIIIFIILNIFVIAKIKIMYNKLNHFIESLKVL